MTKAKSPTPNTSHKCSYTVTANWELWDETCIFNTAPENESLLKFNWERIIGFVFGPFLFFFCCEQFYLNTEHLNVIYNKSMISSWGFHIYRINDKTCKTHCVLLFFPIFEYKAVANSFSEMRLSFRFASGCWNFSFPFHILTTFQIGLPFLTLAQCICLRILRSVLLYIQYVYWMADNFANSLAGNMGISPFSLQFDHLPISTQRPALPYNKIASIWEGWSLCASPETREASQQHLFRAA